MKRTMVWIARSLPYFGIMVFMSVAWTHTVPTVEMRIEPTPVNHALIETVEKIEAEGLTCTDEPSLTDTIVFSMEDGKVRVVSFDKALHLSKSTGGHVEFYCK